MSESKEEIEEIKDNIKFYKDGLKELRSDLSFSVMNAYHTQNKIDEYEDEIMKLEGEL